MSAMTHDTIRRTPPPATLRLTRRGRVVVVLLLAALTFAAFSLGRASTSQAARADRRPPKPTTVVAPGETLWQIARRVAPAHDPRVVVEAIRDLNDLGAAPLATGQHLVLPR